MIKISPVLLVLSCIFFSFSISPRAELNIVSFTGTVGQCSIPYNTCGTFSWETSAAARVSFELGYVTEDGEFLSASRFDDFDLAPTGGITVRLGLNAIIGRLCIIDPIQPESLCAICNPWESDTCLQ